MTYHDDYDPDLHGDEQAPPANTGLAIALTILLAAAPVVLLLWLT